MGYDASHFEILPFDLLQSHSLFLSSFHTLPLTAAPTSARNKRKTGEEYWPSDGHSHKKTQVAVRLLGNLSVSMLLFKASLREQIPAPQSRKNAHKIVVFFILF